MTAGAKRNSKFEWQTAFIHSGLTGNTGFVGLLMSTLDNGKGDGFFVSAKSIESWSGLNERTVRTQIGKLMEEGWVVRTSRGGRRGGFARASTYQLAIPETATRLKLTSQPESADAQPEETVAQPGASARPLDHVSLNPSSLDLSLLCAGDEVSWEQVRELEEDEQRHFFPSFSAGDRWSYEPRATIDVEVVHQQVVTERPAISKDDQRQRGQFVRMNRDEGLDQFGQPLPPRKTQARYRSRT
jgi:hypothetical protein